MYSYLEEFTGAVPPVVQVNQKVSPELPYPDIRAGAHAGIDFQLVATLTSLSGAIPAEIARLSAEVNSLSSFTAMNV
jgi:hypothetical protein